MTVEPNCKTWRSPASRSGFAIASCVSRHASAQNTTQHTLSDTVALLQSTELGPLPALPSSVGTDLAIKNKHAHMSAARPQPASPQKWNWAFALPPGISNCSTLGPATPAGAKVTGAGGKWRSPRLRRLRRPRPSPRVKRRGALETDIRVSSSRRCRRHVRAVARHQSRLLLLLRSRRESLGGSLAFCGDGGLALGLAAASSSLYRLICWRMLGSSSSSCMNSSSCSS